MKKGMGLLSSLLEKKMKKKMDDGSSVSITIEKEMEGSDGMMGGGMIKKKTVAEGRAYLDSIRANAAAKNAATAAKVAKLTPSSLERIAQLKAQRSAPLAAPTNPTGGLSAMTGAASAVNQINRSGGISSALKKATAVNQDSRAKGPGMMGYAKGGRIDGCVIKGKTKGTYR